MCKNCFTGFLKIYHNRSLGPVLLIFLFSKKSAPYFLDQHKVQLNLTKIYGGSFKTRDGLGATMSKSE